MHKKSGPDPKPIKDRLLSNRKVDARTGCWLWTGYVLSTGYGAMRVGSLKDSSRRMTGVHRLSFTIFKRYIPAGMLVCHHCDIPLCFNPAHLFLGTQKDNMRDKVDKKRHNFGEAHYLAKTTEKEVVLIRTLWRKNTMSQADIGRKFNMSKKRVNDIVHNRSWKHICLGSK